MRKLKISKEQLRVLEQGNSLKEYLSFSNDRKFNFRTLGKNVYAQLNYIVGTHPVRYKTFRFLFKNNLIKPGETFQGITKFSLTERGYAILAAKGFWKCLKTK